MLMEFPTRGIVAAVVCVMMIAAGQILFKLAAGQWQIDGWSWGTLKGFLSPALITALAIYGIATVLWVYALRVLPLSLALPLNAMVFFIVPLLAHWVVGEPLRAKTFVGAVVIMAGVLVSVL
jgi:undecaprenyl phosphate-alpha-L-ara4N flippase subunit ArnE